ncbi:MAG: hypothetical protein HZB16_05300 [Armatimonadetes bacterium]|nr:hypothetical protein [Armatimonadota bacterium]
MRLTWIALLVSLGGVSAQQPTADYEGRPFVTQQAPVLRFERRAAPRPGGLDYPFAEQTARTAALFSRFPEFRLESCRIHLGGPWYDSDAANGHFSHGITSVMAMPRYREGPVSLSLQPYERKWQLMCDPMWWGYAVRLADKLAAADPADPRVAVLRKFGVDHRMVPDEAAFRALGAACFEGESHSLDSHGRGAKYCMIDIECTEGWEHQRNVFGWLYQGYAEAAAKAGAPIVPVTYGQWTFSVGAYWESERQKETGLPAYLLPEKDFLAGSDPTLRIVNDCSGTLSSDGYLRAIWGNEPFYQRVADGKLVLVDGKLVLVDGKPVYSELGATRAYGQDLRLEKGEAEHTLRDLYVQAQRMYLMQHRRAGDYPSSSTQRRPGLEKTRVGAWTRYTNEGLEEIAQNDRPIPFWELEMLCGLDLFTTDDLVVWTSDMNVVPGKPGADQSQCWKYGAYGVVEAVVKAAHRYSAFEPLHQGDFQWCWFRLPLVDRNLPDGERYDQKPLVFAKLRTYAGQPWIEVWAAWPALDGQPATLRLWFDQGGRRSAAYRVELRNGRSYFHDAWQLPAGLAGLQGRDVWVRFADQQGTTRTWRGDWREKVDESVATPPDYREG